MICMYTNCIKKKWSMDQLVKLILMLAFMRLARYAQDQGGICPWRNTNSSVFHICLFQQQESEAWWTWRDSPLHRAALLQSVGPPRVDLTRTGMAAQFRTWKGHSPKKTKRQHHRICGQKVCLSLHRVICIATSWPLSQVAAAIHTGK